MACGAAVSHGRILGLSYGGQREAGKNVLLRGHVPSLSRVNKSEIKCDWLARCSLEQETDSQNRRATVQSHPHRAWQWVCSPRSRRQEALWR